MDDEKWPLTSKAIADSEQANQRAAERDDGLPPEWLADEPATDPPTFSMLREMAEDPDVGLIELASGVWYQPKRRPDREKYS